MSQRRALLYKQTKEREIQKEQEREIEEESEREKAIAMNKIHHSTMRASTNCILSAVVPATMPVCLIGEEWSGAVGVFCCSLASFFFHKHLRYAGSNTLRASAGASRSVARYIISHTRVRFASRPAV